MSLKPKLPKVGNLIKEHKNDYRYHSAFESGSITGFLCTEGIPTVKSQALGLLPYSDSTVAAGISLPNCSECTLFSSHETSRAARLQQTTVPSL